MGINYSVDKNSSVDVRKRKDQLQFPVLLGMTFILQMLIFLVDRISNPDIAVGVGYIAVVLFSWLFSKNIHSIIIALFCCLLVFIDYSSTSETHPDLFILLPNVFLAIGSILITLVLVILARSQAIDIRQMNNNLEDTVRDRTFELETKIEEIKAKNKIINETQLDLLTAAKLAKESETKFRSLFEGVPDAILLVDSDGLIQNVNNKTQDIFGYDKQELIGQKVKHLMPNYKKILKNFDDEQQAKANSTFETICYNTNKDKFDAEVSIKQLNVNGKLLHSLSIRDITQRKKTEMMLRVQAKSMQAKNKELEQFVYIASHDLQEPLRTISTFTNMLTTEYADKCDANAKMMFDHINSSSERMTNLLTGLLEYGRLGKNSELKKVDCNLLVKAVIEDLKPTIQETEAIIQVDDLPIVRGFETELRILFQNLISNAIKFRKPNMAPIINIGAKRLDSKWQFFIRDNGIGIEEKFNRKIFTIFQRLHKRDVYKGYGIGLAEVKKIVELHNGDISVSSAPNVGATFFFTINDIIL
jgi:PAS domain S-box-containing protein